MTYLVFPACSDPVDIGFAIPSNSFAEFDDLRDFVKKTLDYVVPGVENVHIGLMIYHRDAEVFIKFDQQFDLNELKKLINGISKSDTGQGENRLDVVLQAAANDLFTLRNGIRQGENDNHFSKHNFKVAYDTQFSPTFVVSLERLLKLLSILSDLVVFVETRLIQSMLISTIVSIVSSEIKN